ncbi:MAG: hypothetical protein RJB66_1427 [Pseudomonadota bacterium]|jgi:hypothetical protein
MKIYLKVLVATIAAVSLVVGCSKNSSSSGGASSDMTISGTLSVAQSTMGVPLKIGNLGDVDSFAATSANDLEIYAIAFTVPPAIASANLNPDGSFSVTLPGAKGSTVTAIFRDKTDQSQVGTVVFVDSDKKDLNGNSSESSSIVLNDSVQLGSISLGTDGKVKIPVSQVQTVVGSNESVAVGTAFDPTGVWYMKAFDATVPTGYMTPGACGQGHDGPCVGMPLTLMRFAGKDFTPSGSCTSETACAANAGTDGNDRYALSIWGGDAAQGVGACGYKSGFTGDEARYHARINISAGPTVDGHAITLAHYGYSMPTGFCGDGGAACTSPFNKDWMYRNATSSREIQDCRPMKVNSQYDAWACKAVVKDNNGIVSGASAWNIGIQGGGCFNTATGKPVNVTNWNALGQGTCSGQDASARYGAGFWSNSCAFANVNHDGDNTTADISVTCKNIGGQFVSDGSGEPNLATPYTHNNGQWVAEPAAILANGRKCDFSQDGGAGSNNAKILAGYRCFAEAYWQNVSQAQATGCMREYNFDWSATTPDKFARDDQRGKPKNAFLTNILKYTPDGQMATLEDEEMQKFTVNTGASSSTFCEVSRRTILTFKKISDSRLLVDLKQSGQMNSTDAACLSVAKEAKDGKDVQGAGNLRDQLSPMNLIFYADKNP